MVQHSSARILLQSLEGTYARLGFDVLADPVFANLVVARLVEPTSKLDSIRVLQQLGRNPVHVNTLYNCLRRVVDRDDRTTLATARLGHVTATNGPGVALVLYDLTTLHRTRDAIEAHLTIGFAALAVARRLQEITEMSIKKIVQTLQPVRTVVVTVDQELVAEPTIDTAALRLIHAINEGH